MRKPEVKTRFFAVLLLAAVMVWSWVGCASAPESRRSADRGPDTVVGDPPSVDSEDYEFAAPPRHPGTHGDVQRQGGQTSSAERPSPEGVISRAELNRLLELGPAVVLEHVDTDPRHENGEFVGFRIVDVSEGAQHFLSPKLRVGDVITHVNLVRLQRPNDYLEAWSTLADAQEVRIDFLRDGESMSAVWPVQ